MKTKAILVASLFLLALRPAVVEAKLGAFELKDMVEGASTIVIATVKTTDGTNATLTVDEVLKGSPGATITLDVQKTWPCDVSEAKQKETVLLFLSHDQKTKQNRCYASGRGRMPIDEVKKKKYATFWPEVRMPKGIEIIEGPEPKWDFIRRASLDDLKKYIKKILGESPNK